MVVGLTDDCPVWGTTRLFRVPPQTISHAGLIGGGHVPMPGEVSLAHNDVRFLDELPEIRGHVLEVSRQPLEEGVIRYNLAGVLNPNMLATFAARLLTLRDLGRVQ